MSDIVYLIGAGVNQAIKDFDRLSPPLITNLFQIALKKRKYSDEHYTNKIQDVYDYLEKYWKKTKSDLADSPFDLEQCFTLLERQKENAYQKDQEEYNRLITIEFRLKSFLAEVLSDFEYSGFNHSMYNFGRILVHEQPTILTFNYDCILESIIESASGVNPTIPIEFHDLEPSEEFEIPDELLAYSHSNWNRPLGYGITFDEVQLYQAGVSKYVKGKRFYSHPKNKLYSLPILKLHGSLNWFKYLPVRSFPTFPNEEQPTLGEKEHEIVLVQGHWWFNEPPAHHGWYVDPVIITPTLYKDRYSREPLFKQIWEMARNALSRCRRLVVIGYSFAPTDFSTKQLLLETFSNNDLEELIVVNPDVSVVQIVKDLCHFEGGIVWYKDLEDYIRAFSKTELGANILIKEQSLRVAQEDIPTDTTPHDVYVKCKTCGVEFSVGIKTNPRSFATSIYAGNIHQCPEGHVHQYDKDDYLLKKPVR